MIYNNYLKSNLSTILRHTPARKAGKLHLSTLLIGCCLFFSLYSSAAQSDLAPPQPNPIDLLEPHSAPVTTDTNSHARDELQGDASNPSFLNAPAYDTDTIRRQLWKDNISIFNQNPSKSKQQLQQIIEKIRSAELAAARHEKPSETTQTTPPEHEKDKQSSQTGPAEKVQHKNSKISSDINDTELAIQYIRQLCREPEKVALPFELAEVLFHENYLAEAAVFYQEALKKADPNNQAFSRQKQWILFQTANCLSGDNPELACQKYKELINEFPDSFWSELAKSRVRLLEWYKKENIAELTKNASLSAVRAEKKQKP